MPNILTMLRFILSFPLSYFIYKDKNILITITFFIIILISDFLDGYIARKYNKITNFGKLLDPVADRTFILLITLALLLNKKIPIYSLFIFIRDVLVGIFGYIIMIKNKQVIPSDIYGKAKTVLHFLSLGIIIVIGKWNYISFILLLLGFLTIIPESMYVYKKYLKD